MPRMLSMKVTVKLLSNHLMLMLKCFLSTMLKNISGSQFILSGTKSRMRYIDISQIVENLEDNIWNTLIGLHAFTGCDSVSAFVGKGKKAAFL